MSEKVRVRHSPKNKPQPTSPEQKKSEEKSQLAFTLQANPGDGRPFARVPYTVVKNGSIHDEGITDDFGRLTIDHQIGTPEYTVELANGEKFDLKTYPKFDPSNKSFHKEQTLSNQGERSFDVSPEGRILS